MPFGGNEHYGYPFYSPDFHDEELLRLIDTFAQPLILQWHLSCAVARYAVAKYHDHFLCASGGTNCHKDKAKSRLTGLTRHSD